MALKKIAIIPARSGSKGLPNKNVLMLIDRPLIAYTIESAIKSNIFEHVIVSTDSLEYKYIAEYYGAEVIMRSEELSSDSATSFMVVEDILGRYVGFDYFMLLQPTSPFRNEVHINEAVNLFEQSSYAKFLASVSESDKNVDLIKPLSNDQSLASFDLDYSNYRRQNYKQYTPNGAIFIGDCDCYLKQKHFFGAESLAYIMKKADSVDIDDLFDFDVAIMLQTKKNKKQLLLTSIKKRIQEKKTAFSKIEPITLIGHSIFDFWDIEYLHDKRVNNLGIAGITSEQYHELIFEPGLIKNIGDTVFLMAGTNDIIINGWTPEYTVFWLNKTLNYIKTLNPYSSIYLLSVPPVIGRIERDNTNINMLNHALSQYAKKNKFIEWVPLPSDFFDNYGNLSLELTYDGLHFNNKAYELLQERFLGVLK